MIPLKPVDRVEVLSVMDNSIDVLMGSTPVARRALAFNLEAGAAVRQN